MCMLGQDVVTSAVVLQVAKSFIIRLWQTIVYGDGQEFEKWCDFCPKSRVPNKLEKSPMHSNSLKKRVKSCETQPIMNFIMMCVYFVSIFVKQQTIQHECIKHLNQMNVSFILFFEVKKLIIHMRHNTLLAKISCTLHTQ